MYNGLLDALQGLESPLDQMLTALYQHLNLNVVGDQLAVHQGAQKIVLNLGRRRETHLDLLKAQLHQKVEHLHLLLHHHGLHQSLVAVPQIHAAPYGCFFDLLVRPGALREIHYGYTLISLIIQHTCFLHSSFYGCRFVTRSCQFTSSSARYGQSLDHTVMSDDEQQYSYWFSPILHHSFFLKIAAQRVLNHPQAAPAAHCIQ